MTGLLAGQTVLVVGATAGIGAAVWQRCRAEGADVIGVGRRADRGDALARAHGGRFETGDITDEDWLDAFFARLAGEGIALDGAVNNAAMTQDALPIDSIPQKLFDDIFALNVRATFRCLQHEIAAMRGRGGSIVNVASIAGKRGFPGLSVYSASKHAIIGLTRSAALDTAGDGIRINALLPGTTRTEMFDRQMSTRPGGEAGTVASIPLGRVSDAAEQAETAVWLLSTRSSFVTGETITCDGGATIR